MTKSCMHTHCFELEAESGRVDREEKKSLDKRHRISAVFLRPLIFPILGRRVVSLTLRLVGDL